MRNLKYNALKKYNYKYININKIIIIIIVYNINIMRVKYNLKYNAIGLCVFWSFWHLWGRLLLAPHKNHTGRSSLRRMILLKHTPRGNPCGSERGGGTAPGRIRRRTSREGNSPSARFRRNRGCGPVPSTDRGSSPIKRGGHFFPTNFGG